MTWQVKKIKGSGNRAFIFIWMETQTLLYSLKLLIMSTYKLPAGKALVLRSNNADLTAYGGFQWPDKGKVTCPDWSPVAECGNGLHGWLWAVGNYDLKVKKADAKYLVVEVDADKVVELSGKVKFPEGKVIFCGAFKPAYDLVMKWFWLTQVTFTARNISDESGVSVAAKGLKKNASASGYSGHASASGNSGHASASGDYGHASASGDYGHAVVLGRGGKAKCGTDGAIILTYYDGKRLRHVIGYAGENGIEAGKFYTLNGKNQLTEVK